MLMQMAGTLFMLAGAFFIGFTALSMRAVFADPVQQPVFISTAAAGDAAAANSVSRRNQSARAANVARGTVAAPTAAVAKRGVSSRATQPIAARGVAARSGVPRGVAARTAVSGEMMTPSPARVSLTGSAMRAPTGTNITQTNALRLGSIITENIIDPNTGLISADAYSNCLTSYYTCMDEICAVRKPGARRCTCAGRATDFIQSEQALNTAKEQLLRVAGELSLFIASKGKELSSAFSLTDAEKTMNCVAYQNAKQAGTLDKWCENNIQITGTAQCTGYKTAPSYCNGELGFTLSDLNGSGSDIMSQLNEYINSVQNATNTLYSTESSSWTDAYNSLVGNVNTISGISGLTTTSEDQLAKKWGYQLFAYAQNNVCGRVLDSCFNGIYEACTSNKPYNYTSTVSAGSDGKSITFEPLREQTSTTSTAACFGYTTAVNAQTGRANYSGTSIGTSDPYATLRYPVAKARLSVMQKYVLDANADCDLYGEELKAQAQTISYQNTAVAQALQQKRLEFKQEADAQKLTDYQSASENFGQCISDLYDCYTQMYQSNGTTWMDARIKTYCAQVSQSPSCFETMVCSPATNPVQMVVNNADAETCAYDVEKNTSTCRNVVTLSEILKPVTDSSAAGTNSASLRENCLKTAGVEAVREWERPTTPTP